MGTPKKKEKSDPAPPKPSSGKQLDASSSDDDAAAASVINIFNSKGGRSAQRSPAAPRANGSNKKHSSSSASTAAAALALAASGGGDGVEAAAADLGASLAQMLSVSAGSGAPSSLSAGGASSSSSNHVESFRAALSSLQSSLGSEERDVQLEATKKIRQLLSVERENMVQDVLDRNIVPQLLKFLRDKDHAALQVEALWALTNIAAGTTEHTHLLIKNNAVPELVKLLDSKHQEVLEQAIWVVGNIAGDGATARDTVLRANALEPLLRVIRQNEKTSLLRIATWTLSNLCEGQPRPALDVAAVLVTVKNVLRFEDTEVLSHACWALSHLCEGPSPHIQAVVTAQVCKRLVELLNVKSWRVVKPALRTIGNIVCAEDDQDYTQHIIDCGAVDCLRKLIDHSNREIQKEACWTLSNIAAGTVPQIQCVLDSGSISPLVTLASTGSDVDPDVKIEACWVILNATSCGSDKQIETLVDAGCVSVLCNLLQDTSMVMMALEGLEKILQVGEDIALRTDPPGTNPHAGLLDTEKVDALQNHRSTAIAKRAVRMWKQHYVTCAICSKAYSRHSPSTKFCTECKCNVCTNCDCSVFHLSYQDELWKEMAEGEKAKEETKKSKRQRKRAKERKKRELKEQKKAQQAAASKQSSSVPRNHSRSPKKNASGGAKAKSDSPKTSEVAIASGSVDASETKSSAAANSAAAGAAEIGGKYVDFLMETGSILELARMMDQEDVSHD